MCHQAHEMGFFFLTCGVNVPEFLLSTHKSFLQSFLQKAKVALMSHFLEKEWLEIVLSNTHHPTSIPS